MFYKELILIKIKKSKLKILTIKGDDESLYPNCYLISV